LLLSQAVRASNAYIFYSHSGKIRGGRSPKLAQTALCYNRRLMPQRYFQKGFGLGSEVRPELQDSYRSRIVDLMRTQGSRLVVGDLTFRLAEEFGFCYGVERAVEYAYETVAKFPDRRIFLTGEIIHNPHVNQELESRGIRFLPDGEARYAQLTPEDVVLVPAFGVPRSDLEILAEKNCVVVDTTCGSVLNVWKNVERYSNIGMTSIIHGKYEHEETRATFSRTTFNPESHYLVVRNKDEAAYVCDYLVDGGDRVDFLNLFERAMSDGFDPDLHLQRIGLANQTTMLSSESLEISAMFRSALIRRSGEAGLEDSFIAFDTICSATQDRQDAIRAMEADPPDVMIVIGGYNSSNTNNLARIALKFTRAFHIEDASSILSAREIRHKPPGPKEETCTPDWLGSGPRSIGLTAGASTPNNQIGEAIERIVGFRDTIGLSRLKELIDGRK
jgi:4-hydroxy-3-methylbut-2-enyl diphosphate reductase